MHNKKQQGMTGVGWLIVLALIGFFALLTLRLVPMYMEAYRAKAALESLKQEPLITEKSKSEIVKLLQKRFDVDYIEDLDPGKILTIEKERGVLKLEFKYEIRTHIMGNLDVVGSFDHKVDIVQH